jgi:hypothetical protein
MTPCENIDAIIEKYFDGRTLAAKIKELLRDVLLTPVDWNAFSISNVGAYVRSKFKQKYPDLTDEAIEALVWYFVYSWR